MDDEVARALERLYAEVDDALKHRGWTCRACGACCRFVEYGHELFCSQLEADYLVGDDAPAGAIVAGVCAFLDAGRCTRRDRRTLACRIHHCETASEGEMQAVSEAFIARLKDLHTRFGMPWRYARLSTHLVDCKCLSHKG